MKKIDIDNKNFSLKRNQNRNLWGMLKMYEVENKISIYTVKKYLVSHLYE